MLKFVQYIDSQIFKLAIENESVINLKQSPDTVIPIQKNSINLYDRLKEWRRLTTKATKIPSSSIFWNTVLDNLVKEQPKTKEELILIPGITKFTYEKFGDDILQIINQTDEIINSNLNEIIVKGKYKGKSKSNKNDICMDEINQQLDVINNDITTNNNTNSNANIKITNVTEIPIPDLNEEQLALIQVTLKGSNAFITGILYNSYIFFINAIILII